MTTIMRPEKKLERKQRRANKVKARVVNPRNMKPKLIVFKSNKYTTAIIFDVVSSKILASSSDLSLKAKGSKIEKAKLAGEDVAKKAKTLKITEVVFDRNGYVYHGRVKALADGARSGGLKF